MEHEDDGNQYTVQQEKVPSSESENTSVEIYDKPDPQFENQMKVNDNLDDNKNGNTELPILEVRNLTKKYQSKVAVDDLSFTIKRGEIFGLLGPNGAGKTTTIKSIMGMIEVNRGEIRLLGINPADEPKAVKKRIGYVAEEPLLYDSLTPGELFNFIGSVRELDPNESSQTIENLLTSFDATQYYDDLIATLSKGNKQKMQIIASLMHEPDLLIMDEPLSGLDAKSRKIVRNILELHTATGRSVLLCTHAMEDAQGICDRIGIINKGKVIANGTLAELRKLTEKETSSLEEIFLELTFQTESVEQATARLEGNYNNNNNNRNELDYDQSD